MSTIEPVAHKDNSSRDNIDTKNYKHYLTLLKFGKDEPELMRWINEAWKVVNE